MNDFYDRYRQTLFENSSLKIARILREAFCTPIRNAFAHALYDVNADTREITIYPQT